MLILEEIGHKIASICHKLDCCWFLNEEKRVRLKAELSSLVEMRESYRRTQEELAKEQRGMLKDQG